MVELKGWPFEDSPAAVVVTSTHVTRDKLPILHVFHGLDDEGVSTWQFHCGTLPVSMQHAQLVRLDTIVGLDPTLREIAGLPLGYCAKRSAVAEAWSIEKDE